MLNKIKNNIFLKSTLVLLIGGVIGKLVGFILKIIVTRKLGAEGMGLYSLLTPTSSLLSVIATLSYPTALSKIISEKSSRTKTLFISIIPLSIIINFFIILITILIAPTLSTLLKNEILYYPIICLSLVTPFISISSIIKGYFWGKQNMFPYMLSNFIEQVTRLILITLFIDKFLSISLIHTISFIILINAAGEIISQLVMMYFFPKNIKPSINDFNKNDIKKVMEFISILQTKKLIELKIVTNENNIMEEYISLELFYDKVSMELVEALNKSKEVTPKNIFEILERELGKTLTPMEYEIVKAWKERI